MAQTVKRLPTMQETRVRSLGGEDSLEKEMATHSSTLAWMGEAMVGYSPQGRKELTGLNDFTSLQIAGREQLHPPTENWINDLLSRPNQNKSVSLLLSQSLPLGSFHKPLILLHQRAERLKTTITEH